MKPELARLNFFELLHYGGKPPAQHEYDPPLQCRGYCIHCEEKGNVFDSNEDSFDQMSHGCSTSDYEEILGTKPDKEKGISDPIVFLLENPGGESCSSKEVSFMKNAKEYNKRPPVGHYYWTPKSQEWPTNANDLKNIYGDYFAYLMNEHRLNNVYVTNLIKCNTIGVKKYKYPQARSNCVVKWLKKEIEIFKPKFVFAFGGKTNTGFNLREFKNYFQGIRSLHLYHPAAIYRPAVGINWEDLTACNDSEIEDFLRNHP